MDLTCSETFRRKFPAQPMGPLRAITFSLDNGKEYPLLTSKEPTATRDENGRKRSGKPLNRSRNCIFWSGTETGTKKSDGKTKSVLRDIGNGINRSGAC